MRLQRNDAMFTEVTIWYTNGNARQYGEATTTLLLKSLPFTGVTQMTLTCSFNSLREVKVLRHVRLVLLVMSISMLDFCWQFRKALRSKC
jgi:hypothetical protein